MLALAKPTQNNLTILKKTKRKKKGIFNRETQQCKTTIYGGLRDPHSPSNTHISSA